MSPRFGNTDIQRVSGAGLRSKCSAMARSLATTIHRGGGRIDFQSTDESSLILRSLKQAHFLPGLRRPVKMLESHCQGIMNGRIISVLER
jgi:hypothetical protein